jgi:hypothetical protein
VSWTLDLSTFPLVDLVRLLCDSPTRLLKGG